MHLRSKRRVCAAMDATVLGLPMWGILYAAAWRLHTCASDDIGDAAADLGSVVRAMVCAFPCSICRAHFGRAVVASFPTERTLAASERTVRAGVPRAVQAHAAAAAAAAGPKGRAAPHAWAVEAALIDQRYHALAWLAAINDDAARRKHRAGDEAHAGGAACVPCLPFPRLVRRCLVYGGPVTSWASTRKALALARANAERRSDARIAQDCIAWLGAWTAAVRWEVPAWSAGEANASPAEVALVTGPMHALPPAALTSPGRAGAPQDGKPAVQDDGVGGRRTP